MHGEHEAAPARVFVYGTLKRDGRLNCILRDLQGTFIGEARCYGYTLREMASGVFPAAVPALLPGDYIVGELWSLPDSDVALWVLDRYEGVPHLFMRLSNVDVEVQSAITGEMWIESAVMYALARSSHVHAGPIIGSYFNAAQWDHPFTD